MLKGVAKNHQLYPKPSLLPFLHSSRIVAVYVIAQDKDYIFESPSN